MNLEVLESVEEVLETVLEYFDIEIISCKDYRLLQPSTTFFFSSLLHYVVAISISFISRLFLSVQPNTCRLSPFNAVRCD